MVDLQNPGKRAKRIAITQIAKSPAAFEAIERFRKRGSDDLYIATRIPAELIGDDTRLNRFLKNHRGVSGRYTTAERYDQAVKSDQSIGKSEARSAIHLHQYSSAISGNIAHKSDKELSGLIKRAVSANSEFFRSLKT